RTTARPARAGPPPRSPWAVLPSIGTASRLPAATPPAQPITEGTATWSTYAATTCAGEKPMDFSTPIRRVPATTAPLTTLITISTDITSPISPNATMNGTHGANEAVACALAVNQDCAPSTLPCGSAAVIAAMSVFTAAVVAALENVYSICDSSGAPAACNAAISPGVT